MKLSTYVIVCVLLTMATVIAFAQSTNEVAKQCLHTHGYQQELFTVYDFAPASMCLHEYIAKKQQEQDRALREFLKKNPEYMDPGPQCYIIYSSKRTPQKICEDL